MEKYNLGGILAELEGGESIQTPDGKQMDIEGPSHESGGVKATLPEGTFVYSDAIKGPDGKTMAERKKNRTKSINKVLNASDDPFNMIQRNTLERTLEWAAQEEQADRLVMELAQEVEAVMKWGGEVKMKNGGKVKKYQPGGPVLGDILAQLLAERARDSQLAPIASGPTNARQMNLPAVPSIPTTDLLPTEPIGGASPQTPLLDQLFKVYDSQPGAADGGMLDTAVGLGSLVPGPIGAAIGTFGPLVTTVLNRLGDKENQNPYAGYGQQALGTNTQAQRGIEAGREATIANNALATQDQIANIRNTTSSAGVARAASQGAVASRMRANTQASTQFQDRLSQLLSQRSNMQLNIDDKVMGGADLANERNTMDRDNFFTNLNSDVRNVAKGLMVQGGTDQVDILKILGL